MLEPDPGGRTNADPEPKKKQMRSDLRASKAAGTFLKTSCPAGPMNTFFEIHTEPSRSPH